MKGRDVALIEEGLKYPHQAVTDDGDSSSYAINSLSLSAMEEVGDK